MIRISTDPESVRQMRRLLRSYAAARHRDGELVIRELAAEVAKGLASKVQPWGLKVGKMKKFQGSIQAQVARAVKNANIVGDAATAAKAHSTRRGRRGQVPKQLNTSGRYNQRPIPIGDKITQARKKAALAGTAKGAFLDCARKCFPAVKFPAFFRKFLDNGSMSKTGRGMNTRITITNHLDYIQKAMSSAEITAGIKAGYTTMRAKIRRVINR